MSFLKNQVIARLAWHCGFAILAMAIVIFAGCGPSKSDVKGKVTYNGKPLEKGEVTILSAKGTTHFGAIQPDGSYVVSGVPTGAAKVKVGWIDESAAEFNRQLAMKRREIKSSGVIPNDPSEKPKASLASPERFSDFDKSGLTVEVQGKLTEYNIDLKD
ncbi:MAG TPA: hypothetical protein VGZ47_12070 [Gemmataceae bacterium]|jgi:hypothetical protein|nr:hypothetical protein [Gemmataceae bacterium]